MAIPRKGGLPPDCSPAGGRARTNVANLVLMLDGHSLSASARSLRHMAILAGFALALLLPAHARVIATYKLQPATGGPWSLWW